MQNRAYSVLTVKAFDDDKRTFTGIATTPTVDRVGDIIEPLGVKFQNPMPLLHQHQHDAPIGTVRFKTPTKDGVEFEAQIAKVDEPPALKERVDVAWGEIRHGLVRATSIGFRPIEYSFMDDGGIRYQQVEVYELSTVTIPANADAVITAVKAYDAEARHAAGVPDPDVPGNEPPGTTVRKLDERGQAEHDAFIGNKIPAPPEPAATGKEVRVVRLNDPPASGPPFVIREIRRA